jgi:ssDNA-binding Zn-finger/Zn-ribbon topoisomerase 1
MRRRQIFAAQSAALNNPEPEFIHEEAKETHQATEEVLKVKACPKCGKMIARGMFMHSKYCKG